METQDGKPKRYVIVKVKIPEREDMVKAYIGTDEQWHRVGGDPIPVVERWEAFDGGRR